MERLPVEPVLVGDVVDRGGHVVHRHEVRVAPLDRDQRHPFRQRVADLLEQLEEVVGTVDLVHLAGLGVADHDRWPVDAPRALDPLAHELLGLVLRPVIGALELLALVEHVLGERAVVAARDGDRGDVVEDARANLVGELDRVLRAADVEHRVLRLVGGHVVDGREVEEVVDAGERLAILLGDAEQGLGQVADHRLDAVSGAPALDQLVEPLAGALAHEHVDVPLALEQPLHEVAADESGRTRHEVAHRVSLLGMRGGAYTGVRLADADLGGPRVAAPVREAAVPLDLDPEGERASARRRVRKR